MSPVDQAEQLIQRGGHVHLMGIGGIGMAGLARLLKDRRYRVSGCDLQSNRQTKWLERDGISVFAEHDEAHVDEDVDWLIRSTAVPDSHPEVQRALERGIPVSRRGEVLPALMRDRTCIAVAGTHGKTTTTAMVAQLLDCGYCIGGEVTGFDGVARDGELMVVEADESDGTVAGYTPEYSIITNIEYDHMEHHDSEEAFVGCFAKLIQNTRKKVYYCFADPIAARLCAPDPKCEPFFYPEPPFLISLPGQHNQWNASAAVAVSQNWKSSEHIGSALGQLKPVARRFETVFHRDGIRMISDYAHHPSEIRALIQTAKELNPRRLLVVFQPHRYTRTLALGADFPPSFDGVDQLFLVPVYPASEQPLHGGTTLDLLQRFPECWDDSLHHAASLSAAWDEIKAQLRVGDLLLIVGAGDIEQIARWAAESALCAST